MVNAKLIGLGISTICSYFIFGGFWTIFLGGLIISIGLSIRKSDNYGSMPFSLYPIIIYLILAGIMGGTYWLLR